jgi:hypothetical protein
MKNIEDFNDDELKAIAVLAIKYIYSNQEQIEFRLKHPVGKLAELIQLVTPAKLNHSNLEYAILGEFQ